MEQRKLQDQAYSLIDFSQMQVNFSDVLDVVKADQKINSDQAGVRIDVLEDRMKNIESLLIKLVDQNEERNRKESGTPKQRIEQPSTKLKKNDLLIDQSIPKKSSLSKSSSVSVPSSISKLSSLNHLKINFGSPLTPGSPGTPASSKFPASPPVKTLMSKCSAEPDLSFATPNSNTNYLSANSVERFTRNNTIGSSDDLEFYHVDQNTLQAIDSPMVQLAFSHSNPTEE